MKKKGKKKRVKGRSHERERDEREEREWKYLDSRAHLLNPPIPSNHGNTKPGLTPVNGDTNS